MKSLLECGSIEASFKPSSLIMNLHWNKIMKVIFFSYSR
ncbi:Thioredoxin peroxidase 1 [Rickettsia prowazekii str. Breinl]|nr:hypothetical protein H374_7490 [Rickettsia prowazekii str. NMRC Madrid E]AGJ02510.1 Thioredoxin peroxidase 1 [Rickettsia prowazekii str. Breinl]